MERIARVRSLRGALLCVFVLVAIDGWILRALAGEAVEIAPVITEEKPIEEPALTDRSFEMTQDATGFGDTILTEPSWQSFESTADLLGQGVGAQVRTQGGVSTLSIRGAPAGQIRILLDGVALGRADDAVVNLADIPVEAIDRIEIYRGFAPVGLSASSAASVVNIITKDPRGTAFGAASGIGSYGSGKLVGYGSSAVGKGSAFALASLRTTDGDFKYVNDNGTINNLADDHVSRRTNNESETVAALLRYRRPLGDELRLMLRDHFFYKDEGVPGLARFAAPNANLETTRNIASLGLEAKSGSWALESSVLSEREKLTRSPPNDNVADTIASTTQGRWTRTLARTHKLSGSAEFLYETFDQKPSSDSASPTSAERWSLAVAGGDEWTLTRWNLTASLQLRHQQLWNSFDAETATSTNGNDHSTDPRGGLRWQAMPSLSFKGNVGTYFRPPTFDELFGTDGFTEGNPELEPETGINRDVGLEWSPRVPGLSRFELGYTYFHNDIDEVIVIVQTFSRTFKAINLSEAHITGHEVRLEMQGRWGLALSANYTYQDAVNRSPRVGQQGKKLPGLAPHEAYTRLSWSLPYTHDRAVVSYDVAVDSEHYIDSQNDEPAIPTRVVHGLALMLALAGGFRLSVEAENLGDTLIPDEIGYPLPGRLFFATLSWSGASEDEEHAG